MTTLKIYVNTGTVDDALGEAGVEFTEVSVDNDYLVFSNGSDTVIDGAAIPSASALNRAGALIGAVAQVVAKCFLADISANLLREIHLAGNQNKRHVYCFSFDGATASEPVLEVWDDSDMNTIDDYSLGEGVNTNSWIWGITTTDALPTSSWVGLNPTVGSKLAGSGAGHYLLLNDGDGALPSLGSGITSQELYCQLKIIVPANFENAGAETPVFVCKYTTN